MMLLNGKLTMTNIQTGEQATAECASWQIGFRVCGFVNQIAYGENNPGLIKAEIVSLRNDVYSVFVHDDEYMIRAEYESPFDAI